MSRRLQFWAEDWKLDEGDKLWSDTQPHQDVVVDALEALPSHYRTPIELRFYGGYTYREIADTMNWPGRNYAHQYVKRGLRLLRREIEERIKNATETTG